MPPPCEPLNARIQELLQNLGIVVIKKGNSCVDGLRLASVDFFIEALGVDYMSVIVWGVQRQIGKVVDEAERTTTSRSSSSEYSSSGESRFDEPTSALSFASSPCSKGSAVVVSVMVSACNRETKTEKLSE
jgi:hypothetical protein